MSDPKQAGAAQPADQTPPITKASILVVDDNEQNLELLVAYLEDLGNPYAAIGADPRARMGLDWGVVGLPETFVVDGAGNIVMRFAGPLTEAVIANQIRPAIERAQGGGS